MKLPIIISFLIATIITFISLFIGTLLAPGVFYTIGGGLFGVPWSPQIMQYVIQVYCAYFISSFIASYAAIYFYKKTHNK